MYRLNTTDDYVLHNLIVSLLLYLALNLIAIHNYVFQYRSSIKRQSLKCYRLLIVAYSYLYKLKFDLGLETFTVRSKIEENSNLNILSQFLGNSVKNGKFLLHQIFTDMPRLVNQITSFVAYTIRLTNTHTHTYTRTHTHIHMHACAHTYIVAVNIIVCIIRTQ